MRALADVARTNEPIGGVAASAVFAVPLWRELLLLFGWREASPGLAERMLRAGQSVVVVPGGIHEMVETTHEQDALRLQPNLGFVRLALRCGRPLLPIYAFGETQLLQSTEAQLKITHIALAKKLSGQAQQSVHPC